MKKSPIQIESCSHIRIRHLGRTYIRIDNSWYKLEETENYEKTDEDARTLLNALAEALQT